MAKQKRINWDYVQWTPFEEVDRSSMVAPPGLAAAVLDHRNKTEPHRKVFLNSIYQVEGIPYMLPEPFGRIVHLSFKTRDKQARHDWREMQRIKNELCGEHTEAVEIFPDEDRLVDTSNQYHLWVFMDYKLPFGFKERLVAEGSFPGTGQGGLGYRQRDFRPEFKAPDTLRNDDIQDLKNEERLVGRCPHDGSAFRLTDGVFQCLKEGHKLG